MKKGYRLSSFNAYSNYQIYKQTANFGFGQTLLGAGKQALQGVDEAASALGNAASGGARKFVGQRGAQATREIAESGINQASASADDLAKLAALKKKQANAKTAGRAISNNRKGIGYGVAGAGALGLGGAGLAGASMLNQPKY